MWNVNSVNGKPRVIHFKIKTCLLSSSREIQNGDLIDKIKMQLEGKRQNGRHTKNVKNKLCTFIPAPVPVPECTHVHPRGCRCTHKCISISPKKLSHPTSKAKDKASAMLKSVTKQYARTVHITPCILNHVSGASSTRETTYVIAPRDNVRDRLERQRTWSPRETTYVTPRESETARQRGSEAAMQRGCEAARQWGCQRASERAWSPWSQCHRVWAGVVKGSELFTNQRSLLKASYSN